MARRTVVEQVSDLSGEVIPEGTGAVVKIHFSDGSEHVHQLDVTDEEAHDLAAKGRPIRRRKNRRRDAQGRLMADDGAD